MKSSPFRDGLHLHLLYLGITMQRSSGVAVKDLIPTLINFTQQVMAAQDPGPPPRTTPINNSNGRKRPPSAQSLLNPKQAPRRWMANGEQVHNRQPSLSTGCR